MSMTPYELRFNLLNFAQSSLLNRYHASIEERKVQGAFGKSIDIDPYPTKEDVFALAEEYRKFIETK